MPKFIVQSRPQLCFSRTGLVTAIPVELLEFIERMATLISPQVLSLTQLKVSAAVLPPSSHRQPLLLQSSPVSVVSLAEIRRPKPKRPKRSSFGAQASSAAFEGDTGDFLGDVSIFTASGQPVKFRDLWDQNEGIAVVALLRHFGCPCCWELASVLRESKEIFDSAGVKLIAVGVGTPSKARILAERLPFPIDCLYADPDRKAYNVLGLYYGFSRTFFNPASAKVLSRFESLRNALKNYTIEATPDDRSSVLQQGGMFVFKGKDLLYARKDEGTGDHAPLDDIINICCKVPIS